MPPPAPDSLTHIQKRRGTHTHIHNDALGPDDALGESGCRLGLMLGIFWGKLTYNILKIVSRRLKK